MKKILCLGNSFSQDASTYLERIDGGNALLVRNLMHGGCSLEMHVDYLRKNEKAYTFEKDGAPFIREGAEDARISFLEALDIGGWDVVTVQQVSQYSGIEKTYYPYLTEVLNTIRARSNAQIVLHQTWEYHKDSPHGGFVNYDNDSDKMHACIRETVQSVCKKEGLPVIPVGELIHTLKSHPLFGGERLWRDRFHMSKLGRYAAALCWLYFFTDGKPTISDFIPEECTKEEIQAVQQQVRKMFDAR